MQKWEYCVVTGIHVGERISTYYPRLHLLTSGKAGTYQVGQAKGVEEPVAVAQLLTRLGDEGREMVGVSGANARGYYGLFFKRPKQ